MITNEMTIAEIFEKFPHQSGRLAQAITDAGLHCVGCHAATWETLRDGMMGHGKSLDEVECLLKQLNKILAEEIDLTTITLTPRAAKKFHELADNPTDALRLSIQGDRCSSKEHLLDFSEKAEEDDQTFESHGVQIHINKEMVSQLIGSVIDYVEGHHGSGFKVSNPNTHSCGCGKS
ncbi:MAG: Iron-sulfur cluster insertion protein ErpA [Chlamydiae bacterium]|nr:Iron-sulfur cluster insertion protein ErpA [Chlamydiota bacterium]